MNSKETIKIKKCIICQNNKEENLFSIEHIIPQSLGGTLTIDTVCKECNEKMGNSIDCYLTNNILNNVYRSENNIEGKKGGIPPLIKRKTTDSKGREVKLTIGPNKEYFNLDVVPLVEKRTNDSLTILVPENKTKEIIESCKKKFKKQGKIPKINVTPVLEPPEEYIFIEEINFTGIKMAMLKICHECLLKYKSSYKNSEKYILNSSILYDFIQNNQNEDLKTIEKNIHLFIDKDVSLLNIRNIDFDTSSHIIFFLEKNVFFKIGKITAYFSDSFFIPMLESFIILQQPKKTSSYIQFF